MYDDDDDDYEEDFYADIPDEAFYYEESARRYGLALGFKEASEGIDSESTLDNFRYPEDADDEIIDIFKEAYFEGVDNYNSQDDDDDDEWD